LDLNQKHLRIKMQLRLISALPLAIAFSIHATRASPLPQDTGFCDTGSSFGSLFGSLLVGLGERAVQVNEAIQTCQAVVESGIVGQIQDQAVSDPFLPEHLCNRQIKVA